MEREVGRGIGMGNTCKPMAVSFQCMTKFTTNKKKETKKKIEIIIKIVRTTKKERIQYSVPIFIQESVDSSLPILTLFSTSEHLYLLLSPSLPIQFCESLWVSGLRRTLWEETTV